MGFGFESLGHPAQCHQKSPPVRDSFSNPWGIPRSAIKKAPPVWDSFSNPWGIPRSTIKKGPLVQRGLPTQWAGDCFTNNSSVTTATLDRATSFCWEEAYIFF